MEARRKPRGASRRSNASGFIEFISACAMPRTLWKRSRWSSRSEVVGLPRRCLPRHLRRRRMTSMTRTRNSGVRNRSCCAASLPAVLPVLSVTKSDATGITSDEMSQRSTP